MGERTRKLRLLQGARRIARAQWAAPAGARGSLPAGSASPKLRLQRLRSALHMLPGSDRGLSASRARAPAPRSTFRTVRLRSTPRRAHLLQARARVRWGGAGPYCACVMGCPCGFWAALRRPRVRRRLVRVQQRALVWGSASSTERAKPGDRAPGPWA